MSTTKNVDPGYIADKDALWNSTMRTTCVPPG